MRLGKQRFESKYMAIQYFTEKRQWNINWMCRQLEISRAAYYKWLHRPIPKQEEENINLAELIKEYDERFCHILGYRRMTSWINHFNHTNYSKNRSHRIMKKLGIHSVIRKKKKKYHFSKPETTAENKLKRDFNAGKPNEKWVTDVTEFKIPETGKKLYLSAIFDLYDRYPVAYVISRRNDNQLVFETYGKAIEQNPEARPLFHSDRGYQYTVSYTHLPNPSSMVATGIDEEYIRKEMKTQFDVLKQNHCKFDITLKDVETVNRDPGAIKRWVSIVRSEIEAFSF